MNAVSLHSINTRSKGKDTSLKELEDRGLLIFGKYNVQVENVLKSNFSSLVQNSKLIKMTWKWNYLHARVLETLDTESSC